MKTFLVKIWKYIAGVFRAITACVRGVNKDHARERASKFHPACRVEVLGEVENLDQEDREEAPLEEK